MPAVPGALSTPGVVKIRPDSVKYGGWLNLLFSTFPPDVKEVIQGSHKLEVKAPNNPKHLMREVVASVLG